MNSSLFTNVIFSINAKILANIEFGDFVWYKAKTKDILVTFSLVILFGLVDDGIMLGSQPHPVRGGVCNLMHIHEAHALC